MTLPTPTHCAPPSTTSPNRHGRSDALPPLRTLYRDQLLILAGLDLASTVENEPVPPFSTIGEHLSDIADAALDAALTVATVCGQATPHRASRSSRWANAVRGN